MYQHTFTACYCKRSVHFKGICLHFFCYMLTTERTNTSLVIPRQTLANWMSGDGKFFPPSSLDAFFDSSHAFSRTRRDLIEQRENAVGHEVGRDWTRAKLLQRCAQSDSCLKHRHDVCKWACCIRKQDQVNEHKMCVFLNTRLHSVRSNCSSSVHPTSIKKSL